MICLHRTDLRFSHRHFIIGAVLLGNKVNWPRGYKTFFMLTSVEHEFFLDHKC